MYIADPFETIKKLTFPTFRNLRCHSVLGILVFWLSRSFLFWVSPLGYYFESETEKIMTVWTFPNVQNCSVSRPTLTVTFLILSNELRHKLFRHREGMLRY